ncbi:hypothetical protein BBP40_006867 [Aspergillus hancockii]|nr:hypothetical protein BBP40_006867 [Aspergillus hancockii]
MSKLTIGQKPEKLSLEDLASCAFDQNSALEDYVHLCRNEPLFLAHAVIEWHESRLESVLDETRLPLPVFTDKYIGIGFFEMIHHSVLRAAIWGYIHCLLQSLMNGPNDRVYKGIFHQELSNVCQFEYEISQRLFKRYIQMGSGRACFKRISGVYDDGTARVTMKIKPEAMTRVDPQLHYLLRLCHATTIVSKAVDWIKKLDEFHQAHPAERVWMRQSEFDALGDLAITTSFVRSLSASLPMPPINSKKGQTYISGLKALRSEIDLLKFDIDLLNFVVPIEYLLEAGIAKSAINTFEQYIVSKTGIGIELRYQKLNEECLSHLRNQYEQQKERNAQVVHTDTGLSIPEALSSVFKIEEHKQKAKTRPQHSSDHSIVITTLPAAELESEPPSKLFKVKSTTFEVFSTFFSKSKARGSVNWSASEAAMVDMGFSVIPKFGSIYTFSPVKNSDFRNSITVHRPHESRIEGYRLLIFARRLKRKFGWEETSFMAA